MEIGEYIENLENTIRLLNRKIDELQEENKDLKKLIDYKNEFINSVIDNYI